MHALVPSQSNRASETCKVWDRVCNKKIQWRCFQASLKKLYKYVEPCLHLVCLSVATENQLWICQMWSETMVWVPQILLSTSSALIGWQNLLGSHWSAVRVQATTLLFFAVWSTAHHAWTQCKSALWLVADETDATLQQVRPLGDSRETLGRLLRWKNIASGWRTFARRSASEQWGASKENFFYGFSSSALVPGLKTLCQRYQIDTTYQSLFLSWLGISFKFMCWPFDRTPTQKKIQFAMEGFSQHAPPWPLTQNLFQRCFQSSGKDQKATGEFDDLADFDGDCAVGKGQEATLLVSLCILVVLLMRSIEKHKVYYECF